MNVVSLITSKGGSGKSTLAASLAVTAAQDGEVVVIVDTDPQGTVTAWEKRRGDYQRDVRPLDAGVVHRAAEPAQLVDLLRRLREHGGTTLVIVDTAGIAGPGAIIAARASDLVLVPVRPTQLDFDAAKATAEALRGVARRFAFVSSQVPTSAPERARTAAESLARRGTTAPAYTSSRVAYHDAMVDGLGVTEHDPRGRAADEVRALWAWTKGEL